MLQKIKNIKIVQSFLILKGNTRISVTFEPLFGISYTFYNFYLSLYMREMGITEQQIGAIIAVGFVSGAFFSLFGGAATDYFGRKKATFIFDFLAWPLALFIYFVSRSFTMFILATVVNSIAKIVSISWNLMVVEDADTDQRKIAYNLLSIINISSGIITPLAGLLVASLGIIRSERIFMIFAIISMSAMIIFRNKKYTETAVGQQILAEHKGLRLKDVMKKGLYGGAVKYACGNRRLRLVILIQVLFIVVLPLGGFNSLYFAPFMTDQLGISKATVSVLGSVYAGVTLFVFLVINPVVSKKHAKSSILLGLILQGTALLGIALMPVGVMFFAILGVGLYAFGYSIFIPFFNALLADVSEGQVRAGIYSLIHTITSILGTIIGFTSGYLYAEEPRLIFFITVFILMLCIGAMLAFLAYEKRHRNIEQV